MVWQALLAALLKPVLYVAALVTSWFGGRKSAQSDIKLQAAKRDLEVVHKAEEVENEVEALRPDALAVRSARWVRDANK